MKVVNYLLVLFLSVVVLAVTGCLPGLRSPSTEPVAVRFAFTVDESVCDRTPANDAPR